MDRSTRWRLRLRRPATRSVTMWRLQPITVRMERTRALHTESSTPNGINGIRRATHLDVRCTLATEQIEQHESPRVPWSLHRYDGGCVQWDQFGSTRRSCVRTRCGWSWSGAGPRPLGWRDQGGRREARACTPSRSGTGFASPRSMRPPGRVDHRGQGPDRGARAGELRVAPGERDLEVARRLSSGRSSTADRSVDRLHRRAPRHVRGRADLRGPRRSPRPPTTPPRSGRRAPGAGP